MGIDLSALDKLTGGAGAAVDGDGASATAAAQNGTQGLETPFTGRHYVRLEAEREQAQRSAAICREYQENIKRSGQLMTAITKGIQEGADLYQLLLWAMEALGKLTSDPLFYNQGKENLQAIYGALGYHAPITQEVQEVQERLDRLTAALERETAADGQRRIESAIRAHRRRLDSLQTACKQADR